MDISRSALALSFLVLLGAAGAAWAEERAPLFLRVGEQRLLRVPGLARYSLGSAVGQGVVKIHPLAQSLSAREAKESLLIRGAQPGTGDLFIWKTDGSSIHRTIQVERAETPDLPVPLLRALSKLEECEVLLAGPGAILRGTLNDPAEAARVSVLLRAFPSHLLDETELSEPLLLRGRQALEALLPKLNQPQGGATQLRLEQVAETLWVRGSVDRKSDQAAIERKLRAAFPPVELELESLPDSSPTVHFKVFLLELRKSRIGNFGLSWPALQEGAFRVTTGAIQNMVQLDLTLQALEGEGSVRVLSNPELVVRAPGEAQLFAGGELPISMRTHYYQNVSWKNYGLTLKLKVTGTTATKVRLDIFTEVSRLDPGLTMDNVPSLQTNRMNTVVDARYGVPLFLSGLLQQGTRETAKGVPLLRSIPILGSLFGSDDYLNDRSELVAILLPGFDPPPAPMKRVLSARSALEKKTGLGEGADWAEVGGASGSDADQSQGKAASAEYRSGVQDPHGMQPVGARRIPWALLR